MLLKITAKTKNKASGVFCLLVILLGTFLLNGLIAAESGVASVTLVENGKVKCVIVASEGLSISEKNAIVELQKYIQEMSGAGNIEVKTPGNPGSDPERARIVVGNQTVRKLYPDEKLDDLGTDGFILKTIGNSVLVAGGEKRGTLYAAFALLETFGCRWWATDATHIPKLDTLTVPPVNRREIPKVEYRDMLYGDRDSSLYSHNKVNGFNFSKNPEEFGGRFNFTGNLVHSHMALMEQGGSYKEHPEYWALVNDKRNPGQVCPSEPGTFEVMKASVIKILKEHPEDKFIVVGQNDNGNYCRCDACKALAASEESPGAPYLFLANKIAEVVEKEFPGKWVQTPAYTWSRKPPKNLKPRSNVGITLCSIECDFNRPLEEMSTPANKAFAEDIIKWSKIAPKLYIWDYTTDFWHYLMPFPNLDAIVSNIKFLVSNGAKGIFEQGSHNTQGAEFGPLRVWVMARAMWNPDKADGKTLIKEFLDGYYGSAGTSIQKYIDIMHAPGRANPSMAVRCGTALNSAWLSPENIADSEAVFMEAERAVANDHVLLTRVRHAHMPIWYMLLKRGTQSKTWATTVAKVGKLDVVDIAGKFAKTIAVSKASLMNEHDPVKPFVEWAKDYAAKAAQTPPLPPELKNVNPESYCLFQACQMEGRSSDWSRDAEASDGWVSEITPASWATSFRRGIFMGPFDNLGAGKIYKLFARVKALEKNGVAVVSGKTNKNSIKKNIPASELADGKFHTIEVGEIVYTGETLSFGPQPTTAPGNIVMDCFWLQEKK